MVYHSGNQDKFAFVVRGTCGLVLALCLTAGVQARQNQPAQQDQSSPQNQPAAQDQQQPPPAAQPQQQPPDAQPKPKYAPQDADRSPYANDRRASGAYGQAPPPDSSAQNGPVQNGPGQNGRAPYGPPQQYGPEQNGGAQNEPNPQQRSVPPVLTIPAGTEVVVRINELLSSDRNQVGDRFTAVLQQSLVAYGWVVARRGQVLTGQVEAAQKAGRVKGVSQLGLELTDLTLVDGQQKPILTELWKASGGTSHGQDAATIGGTTALGAAIGAAADWGTGAAIGAGAGAAAGIGAVLLTRGRPTFIPPETELTFRLVDPVKVDTTQSQQAFLPVSQQDFEGGREGYRPRMAAGYGAPGYPGYPGPAYPCGYYETCYGYPPYEYVYPGYLGWGYYPGYWWGPGFYYGGFYGRGFYGGFRGRGFRR